MSGIFEKLVFYFQYPFVWYALIVGVLIALCSSLLGVTLVLKRFSFIGFKIKDCLSRCGNIVLECKKEETKNILFSFFNLKKFLE